MLGRSANTLTPTAVTLDDSSKIPSELTVVAVGVRPEDGLARDAGLDVHEGGGILVDRQHRTSDPRIFAVGDAALKHDAISGSESFIPLAQTANRHGRLVADVIAGRDVESPAVLGTAIVGAFGMQAAATGWNEKKLRAAGRDYLAIHAHPMNQAGYYPGASQLHLKLLVDPDTEAILGAQAVGTDGADKRIDVIATAMRAGLRASELADLELAYAPQFGSAKDPVNFLGMIAENRLRADGFRERTVQWHELESALESGHVLVDVRSAGEFEAGSIPGAVNVPLDDLRGLAASGSLPAEIVSAAERGQLIVHCQVGLRGHAAVSMLAGHGVSAVNLDGGYLTWSAGVGA